MKHKITKREAFEYSLMMWDHLALYPRLTIPEVIGFLGLPPSGNLDYLCDYVTHHHYKAGCEKCLVKWRKGDTCVESEYDTWLTSRSKKTARVITNSILESYNKAFQEEV